MEQSSSVSDVRRESLLDKLINAEEVPSSMPSHQLDDLCSSGPISPGFFRIGTDPETNSVEETVEMIGKGTEEALDDLEIKTFLIKCEYCDMQFTKRNNYSRHVNSHTQEKQFNCRFCKKLYLRKDQWKNHLMSHMKAGSGFDCPVNKCDKQFELHNDLREHLENNHCITQDSPAECKLCQKTIEKSERLLVHYQTEHEEVIPKILNTKFEPVYPSLDDLAIQKNSPPKIKKRPRAKSMSVRLVKQETVKEATVPRKSVYICGECDRPFSTSGNLSRHRKTHLNLTPFECRQCNRCFATRFQMNNHMLDHNRPKLEINCPMGACEECFEKEQDLRNHLEKDHDIAELECKDCNQLFPNSQLLSEHFQAEHQEVAPRAISPAKASSPEKLSDMPELIPIDSDHSLEIDDDDDHVPVDRGSEEAIEDSTTFYFSEGVPMIQDFTTSPDNNSSSAEASEQPREPSLLPEEAAEVAVQPNPDVMKCEPCGITFDDTTLFLIHRIFHSPEHPFKCGVCKKQLEDKYQFNLHLIYSREH